MRDQSPKYFHFYDKETGHPRVINTAYIIRIGTNCFDQNTIKYTVLMPDCWIVLSEPDGSRLVRMLGAPMDITTKYSV